MEVEGYLRTAGRFDAIYSQTHNVAYKIRGSTPLTVVIDAPNLTLARWGWNARLPYTRVTWRPSISQERNVIGRAKAVIVRSEWSKKIIMDEYGTEDGKVSVVPSPIAIPDIQKEREAGGKLRLLFVGADFERKGGHTLLEAFAHGLKERCELDIVTRSDVQPTLEVRVHKDITDAELDGLYRRADIFVFPTVHEPYGRVVAEAMAYGLPVVASDVAAIPEILSGGECGELVPPGDAAALARAVSGLAGDEVARKTLGLKAREKAIREYDTDKVCARVLDIVKSTVG
jgi:glycosyltransferase involved in cell wall biosynthesis